MSFIPILKWIHKYFDQKYVMEIWMGYQCHFYLDTFSDQAGPAHRKNAIINYYRPSDSVDNKTEIWEISQKFCYR